MTGIITAARRSTMRSSLLTWNRRYREEIADEYAAEGDVQPGAEKKPCRFLRKDSSGVWTSCAIYATRPKVCRDFRCYRMLIYNREGMTCGRVIGKNTVRTDDPALEKLWNDQVTQIPCGDTAAWTKQVNAILAAHGYRAETVE